MLRNELRRMLSSRKLYLSLSLSFLMLCIGGMDFIGEFLDKSPSSGDFLEKFLVSIFFGMTSLLGLCFPVIAVIPYAFSFRDERDCGYQMLLQTKSSGIRYLLAKLSAVFCAGFLVIFVPSFLYLVFCRFVLGDGTPGSHSLYITVSIARSLYESGSGAYRFLYGVLYCLNAGLQGGVFALLGAGMSSFLRSRFLAALIPLCYCIFSASVLVAFHPALNALSIFSISDYHGTGLGYGGILLYDLCIILSALPSFFIDSRS